MHALSLTIRLIALFAVFAAAACQRQDSLSVTSEVDEPHYRRGQQLVKSGRNQEALAAFLKVIEKRGDGAPESHLEAGLLHLQHIKDPIAAIYHFRKYLELRPNSRQAELVKARIETATKEFARTLPAQPMANQMERLDLMELVDKLQRENLVLKEQLASARGGTPGAAGTQVVISDIPQPLPPRSLPAAGADRTGARPVQPAPAAAAVGRRHVVVPGDTLYSLATRYYGNGARWPEIAAANGLKNEPLRIGMELRIP